MPTTPDLLDARRHELKGSPELGALAARLRNLLAPLLEGEIYFPHEKPLLSRDGGVCNHDGTRLSFDPLNPHVHACPRCARTFEGDRHHRAWAWRYHLWLSERAIHLAVVGALNDDRILLERARAILELYAARYRDFPNANNVLGPTRLFFSTYLESIWLTQIIVASMVLRTHEPAFGTECRELTEVIRESADIISSFDEGWSNRQVWNNTAMMAAGLWLSDDRLFGMGLQGPHGVIAQLKTAVSSDGLWFEGENYHFFALRGLLLAAELLRSMEVDLYRGALRQMFAAPLATLLPDLTLPARGDAPYGVSVRQPRFAELWEIGWARTQDNRLESMLTELYESDAPLRADPGISEIAEQETNRPPQALTRDLLGWKALLWMEVRPPRESRMRWRTGSALLQSSGVAVLRGDSRYIGVECGGHAGGHGHPDLLHLTLYWEEAILADFGTASYVSPSLHWYRSTLAHNAPGMRGVGQLGRHAWCESFDDGPNWMWCRVRANDLLGDGTAVRRTIIAGSSYVLDMVDVEAPANVVVDLPIHLLGNWTRLLEQLHPPSDEPHRVSDDHRVLCLVPRSGEELLLASELGPPTSQFAEGEVVTFLARRAAGSGRWIQCFGLGDELPATINVTSDEVAVVFADDTRDRVLLGDTTCRIIDRHGDAHELDGTQPQPPAPPLATFPSSDRVRCPLITRIPSAEAWNEIVPADAVRQLDGKHYRQSELRYGERGPFTAQVAVCASGHHLCFGVIVTKSELCFRSTHAIDPGFDNETADIHSDGVQVYVHDQSWCGYLVIPVNESRTVRIRAVRGTAADETRVHGTWQRTVTGYTMVIAVDLKRPIRRGDRIPVALVVNEMYPDRTRRAGQLAWVAGGQWVYLRGDREDPRNVVMAEVS